jgi:sorbitol-specific phosphotransferase system component IIA
MQKKKFDERDGVDMNLDKVKKASQLNPGDRLGVDDGVFSVLSVTSRHQTTRDLLGVTRVHFNDEFYIDYPPGAIVALE